jgi:hypothetical protein
MPYFTTLEIPVFEAIHSVTLAQVFGGGCKHSKSSGKRALEAPASTGQSSPSSADSGGMSPQSSGSPSSQSAQSSQPPMSSMSGPSASLLAAPLASLSQAIQSVQQAIGQMGTGAQQ